MNTLFYHNFSEAEALKQSFISWIAKSAHIGNGKTAVLKDIIIRQKRETKSIKSPERLYRIIFEFDDNLRLSCHEFLFYNGLDSVLQKEKAE